MAPKIYCLDDQTINQIAAGEVIENAASCIKELIENAIDAKASFIDVKTVAGGRKKIVVSDNGCGMSFEDARTSLRRHATSKIRIAKDVHTVVSMGFRGEALPSIASIAKLTLLTSNGEVGARVAARGGKILEHAVAAHQTGTTIEVESLFYNVPARLQFQKSVEADQREIVKVVSNLALANPLISFKLTQDNKEVFHLLAQRSLSALENMRARIEVLYGHEIANACTPIEIECQDLRLSGLISNPSHHRPNRLRQQLFVNGRLVDSKLISVAVKEGYGTRLPEGRYPMYFLFLDIPVDQIDVNVHPQKKEIRFKEPFEVKRKVSQLIDRAHQNEALAEQAIPTGVDTEILSRLYSTPFNYRTHTEPSSDLFAKQAPQYFPEPTLNFIPHVIGVFKDYIFASAESLSSKMKLQEGQQAGLVLVHQKRAYERIAYDALIDRKEKVATQNLLLAETLEFSEDQARVVENALPLFQELGVSIRSIGTRTFILDGLPDLLPSSAAKDLIDQVLQELDSASTVLQKHQKEQLAKAITRSVHWNRVVDAPSAQTLITKLFKCKEFEFSPHKKPILVRLRVEDLAKMFKS